MPGDTRAELGCPRGSCTAILDSGTSLIMAPVSVVSRAVEALNALGRDCSNLTSLPRLEFELSGKKFSLPPESYIAEVVGHIPPRFAKYMKKHDTTTYRQCKVLLMTMDVATTQGPLWILGMPFFREYYTSFATGNAS